MKKYAVLIAMLVSVLSLTGQEVHKSGKVEVPELGPSAYKLVTFKMSTEKGQIGAPMTLRFKDSQGNVLFETNLGNKEKQTTEVEMAVKLVDLKTTEMVTVFPELVIGEEVVVPDQPVHVPAGMLERMMKLKRSGATSSSKDKNYCSQPLCGCRAPDGCYVSYYECGCGVNSYRICVYACNGMSR